MHHRPTLAILLFTVAGCAPGPTSAPTLMDTAIPGSESSPTSSIPTTDPASELVEVAVDSLAIEPMPDGIAGPDVRVLPATVPIGTRLWILDEIDGWMLVVALDQGFEEVTPIGWVVTQRDGSQTTGAVDLACPPPQLTVPDLVNLGSLGGLACYASRQVELVGFTPLGCGAGGSPRSGTPEWLNGTWTGTSIGNREPMPPDFEVEFGISAKTAPGARVPDGCGEPGWYRFTGHFDDSASATCRTVVADVRPIFIEPAVSQLLCRGKLVLDSAVRLPR